VLSDHVGEEGCERREIEARGEVYVGDC